MPRYFSERGRSHEEVIDRIRDKYGDRARIQMHRNVPASGIMGLFGREQVEYRGYVPTGEEARSDQKSRDDENRAAILAAAGHPAAASGGGTGLGLGVSLETDTSSGTSPGSMTPASGMRAGGAAPGDGTAGNMGLGEVLRELKDLKGRLAVGAAAPAPEPFPALSSLSTVLEENDCESSFIRSVTSYLRSRLTAAELEDETRVHVEAASYMAGQLGCYRPSGTGGPQVFVLVGPTGVGKTTTIAKLAAVNGLAGGGKKVRIVTVDSFRIGARAQVETYGEIMDIPVKAVDDYDELRAYIALSSDADLILVDTIGKSPRDGEKLEEMRKLLSACGENAEVHLALSATTRTADLREIMTQFEPFSYRSVILTKLDETSRVGNLVGLLCETGVPLSYMTDGQSVPVDISVASPARMLGRLRGLEYDRRVLEQQYPAADLTAAWR